MNKLTDFVKGCIAGFAAAAVLFGVGCVFWVLRNRDKELVQYAEKRIEIEALREGVISRDAADFLEVPGVRGAADGATAEFERKRNEAVQRLRSGLAD